MVVVVFLVQKGPLGYRDSEPRLGGPLNRLNAILSLLHPLDLYRTPSAIGSAIGRPHMSPYLASKHRWEGSL